MQDLPQAWANEKRQVRQQVGNGLQAPTDDLLSINEFRRQYPEITTGMSALCYPPINHWIAKIDESTHLWVSISDQEISPEDYQIA